MFVTWSSAFIRSRCQAKGNSIELKTFKSYGVDEILGFKMEEKDGQTYVNFIWCKVCTRNEEGIKKHPKLWGNTKVSAILNTKACNCEYLIV